MFCEDTWAVQSGEKVASLLSAALQGGKAEGGVTHWFLEPMVGGAWHRAVPWEGLMGQQGKFLC